MIEPFLISDDRLRTLSATRQGRVSIAGYNCWQMQHHILVASFKRLHLALLRSLKLHDSEVVRKVLKLSHDVTAEWCVRNPSSGLQYDLLLP